MLTACIRRHFDLHNTRIKIHFDGLLDLLLGPIQDLLNTKAPVPMGTNALSVVPPRLGLASLTKNPAGDATGMVQEASLTLFGYKHTLCLDNGGISGAGYSEGTPFALQL